MKWFRFIALLVVGLVLLLVVLGIAVALIGLMLPKNHRATRIARFKQSPGAVFAAITGAQDWRPGIKVIELPNTGGPRRWREDSSNGSITFEEAASDPPRLYRSRIIGEHLQFGGTWTWEMTQTADGCTCRITEDGEVYNPIFRFVGRFIIGYTGTMETYLKSMGEKFGETVEIAN